MTLHWGKRREHLYFPRPELQSPFEIIIFRMPGHGRRIRELARCDLMFAAPSPFDCKPDGNLAANRPEVGGISVFVFERVQFCNSRPDKLVPLLM